jgi:hypothetical protein
MMDTVHSPEPEAIAQMERLNLEAYDLQKKMEEADSEEERHALDRQLASLQRQLKKLNHMPS